MRNPSLGIASALYPADDAPASTASTTLTNKGPLAPHVGFAPFHSPALSSPEPLPPPFAEHTVVPAKQALAALRACHTRPVAFRPSIPTSSFTLHESYHGLSPTNCRPFAACPPPISRSTHTHTGRNCNPEAACRRVGWRCCRRQRRAGLLPQRTHRPKRADGNPRTQEHQGD